MQDFTQHQLDEKISGFLTRKLHQYPELNHVERSSSIKPVEKHQSHRLRSTIFSSIRLNHAA